MIAPTAACVECAANTYKDVPGNEACTNCTAFSTSSPGSDNETDCVCASGYKKVDDQSCDLECAPGFEAGPNELHCYGCQENHYKDTAGDHACTQCPPNSYHNLRNQTSIDSCICQWGYIKSEDGLTCNECPTGTFNNQNGESGCFDCYGTPLQDSPTITWVIKPTGGHGRDTSCDQICEAESMMCHQATFDGPLLDKAAVVAILTEMGEPVVDSYHVVNGFEINYNHANYYYGHQAKCQVAPYWRDTNMYNNEDLNCESRSQCHLTINDVRSRDRVDP